MSSLEVCRRIKARNEPTAIPVLHVAADNENGSGHADEVQRCADACLKEPVESEIFLATARALLRMRHAEEALEREIAHRQRGNRALRLLSETTRALLAGDSPPEELLAGLYPRFAAELGLEVYFHYQTVPGRRRQTHLRAYGGVSRGGREASCSLWNWGNRSAEPRR